MKVLLIDHEDSFVYNLAQAFGRLGADVEVVRYHADPRSVTSRRWDAVVLSPGPGAPADLRLTRLARKFLHPSRTMAPVLGVCFGHELIGEVFGARVVRAPSPVHGAVAPILHGRDGIFRRLPSPFEGARYHSLVLGRSSIPTELEVTARTPRGVVMGVRHRSFPIWGVQFHPESYLTPEGPALLENFLREVRA